MPTQMYAANGEHLKHSVFILSVDLQKIGLPYDLDSDLPQGLTAIHFAEGLVSVITSPNVKATKMRIGKFLKRHKYPEAEINTISAKLSELKTMLQAPYKLTTSSEEVIDVYNRGPHSCMKGSDSVGVYATDDVAVAYLEVNGEVLARTVVCSNEEIGKHYVSAYGFKEPLIQQLENDGFIEGDLEGCELKLIKDRNNVLMPYLDGCTNVDVHSDYIQIDSCGVYEAQSTSGYLYKTCENCGCVEDDMIWSEYLEESLCTDCYYEMHVEIDNDWYHIESDEIQKLENDDYALSEDAVYIEYREEWHLLEDCIENTYNSEWILREDIG